MGKEYTAKSFKSGNSVAIRMPAALGVKPDLEWTVVEDNGELHLKAKGPVARKLDVARFWGKAAGMIHVPEAREDFAPRPSASRTKP